MDAKTEWPPASPEGYRLHSPDPKHEQSRSVSSVLDVWVVAVIIAVPTFTIAIHGFDTTATIIREVFQPDGSEEWILFLGWVVLTFGGFMLIHESLHAFVGRLFGLHTTFAFEYDNPLDWSPEIVTHGEFQSRGQSLVIALAPLVLLTLLGVVVLVVGQNLWVIATGAVVVLGNTAAAIGDLGSAWILWRLPNGELIYHDSEGRRQYYTPIVE